MTVRLLALPLLLATLALAACGGEDKGAGIPQGTASELLSELAAVQNRLDQGSVGACEDVLDESVPNIQKKLDSLPDNTDAGLRTALEDSFTKLRTLSEQTEDKKTTETETTPPPTTTETAPPTTTTTETAPPTTETTPKPKPKPKNNGNGKGNGNGGSGGAGGGGGGGGTGGAGLPVDPN